METVQQFKASIRTFNVTENIRNSSYEINTNIAVRSNMELDKVLSQLKVLRGVHKVARV